MIKTQIAMTNMYNENNYDNNNNNYYGNLPKQDYNKK